MRSDNRIARHRMAAVLCALCLGLIGTAASAEGLHYVAELDMQGPGLSVAIGGVGLVDQDVLPLKGGNGFDLDRRVDLVGIVEGDTRNGEIFIEIPGPVLQAYLYWVGQGVEAGSQEMDFDGTLFTGEFIGVEHVVADALAYRADVTEVIQNRFGVDGPGLYEFPLSDPSPDDNLTQIDGAGLIVICTDPADTSEYRLIVYHGADYAYRGYSSGPHAVTTPVVFDHGAAAADRAAQLYVFVGDATAAREDRILISGQPSLENVLNSSAGPEWDADQIGLTIPASALTTSVELVSPQEFTTSDSLIWSMAALRVPLLGEPDGACCLANGSCVEIPELDCLQQGGLWQGQGSSCVGVQCPQPLGACCFPVGNCFEFLELDCELAGGAWQGPGTHCTAVTCPQPVAACCFSDGTCQDLEEADCVALGGIWQGFGNPCSTVVCPQGGACCLPDGTCRQETEPGGADCVADGGVYQGDGTSCAMVVCVRGACCLPRGSCADDITQPGCEMQGGQWQGLGSTCAGSVCPQPGACCLPDGTCRQETFTGGADCAADGGVYQGDDTTCAAVTCAAGACCLPDGTCVDDTGQDECETTLGGAWQGLGSSCAAVNCAQPVGACCLPDGTCADDTEQGECETTLGGAWQGSGSTCAAVVCPQGGACCLPNGTCRQEPIIGGAACAADGGTYQGDDTICATVSCPGGACCLPDGTCMDDTAQPDCKTLLGGQWQGLGSVCAAVSCDQPQGACCFPDGSCQDLAEADCTAQGGVWQGLGSNCALFMCDQPPGACCFDDGTCQDLPEVDCMAQGGSWSGFGTDCATFDCPGGACCLPSGACAEPTSQPDCETTLGGVWQGLGSTCATANCPQAGACCLPDGTCRQETVVGGGDCTADGGVYQGDDTDCAMVSCPGGACCLPDGSCLDDTEQVECETMLGGAWQGLGSTCAAVSCDQPEGACCLPNGSCLDAEEADCTAQGGAWQGFGTSCATFNCPQPPGACCFPFGNCQDLLETDCVAQGGVWEGFGTSCATFPCPQPVAACCFPDGTCVDLEEAPCTAAGAAWQGFGTSCATVNCPQPPGACCFPDGGCADLLQVDCLDLGGAWSGPATACATTECPRARGDCTEKGSLLVFSKVELRWDVAGNLIQDTFIQITNDYPADVKVQMYFINGDPPLEASGNERAHPGWNWVDNLISLTMNETTFWSAATGLPEGVSPFAGVLDPGLPPGRPDPDVPGERMMRGYILAWAVDGADREIRWNQLAGAATIVNYAQAFAWEYNACGFRVVDPAVNHGEQTGTPGALNLDGIEYAQAPAQLLLEFYASGVTLGMSGPIDTDLTLHPLSADLRQETEGPVTTKAHFDVWNNNEVKFSGAYRCITCWDQTLLSNYGIPNHFILQNLQTDCGKARIDGLASQLCDVDFDPANNDDFPFPPGPGDNVDPRDVISVPAALLGVRAKLIQFDADLAAAAGGNLVGMGKESAVIRYDIPVPPQEGQAPQQVIDWLLRELGVGEEEPAPSGP